MRPRTYVRTETDLLENPLGSPGAGPGLDRKPPDTNTQKPKTAKVGRQLSRDEGGRDTFFSTHPVRTYMGLPCTKGAQS